MFNQITSVLAGCMVAVMVIFLMEGISHAIFPYPEGVNYDDKEALELIAGAMPIGSFLMVLAAYFMGSLVGGLVSTIISKPKQLLPAMIVGGILMLLGFFNLISFPHPVWFWIASFVMYFPGAYLGYFIILKFKKS